MCHTGVSRTLSVSYRCQSDLECVTQVSVSSAHEYSALVHRSMCNVCGVFRQNATFPDTARCKSAKRRRPHVHAPLPGGDKKIAGVERRDSSERKKTAVLKTKSPLFTSSLKTPVLDYTSWGPQLLQQIPALGIQTPRTETTP